MWVYRDKNTMEVRVAFDTNEGTSTLFDNEEAVEIPDTMDEFFNKVSKLTNSEGFKLDKDKKVKEKDK